MLAIFFHSAYTFSHSLTHKIFPLYIFQVKSQKSFFNFSFLILFFTFHEFICASLTGIKLILFHILQICVLTPSHTLCLLYTYCVVMESSTNMITNVTFSWKFSSHTIGKFSQKNLFTCDLLKSIKTLSTLSSAYILSLFNLSLSLSLAVLRDFFFRAKISKIERKNLFNDFFTRMHVYVKSKSS